MVTYRKDLARNHWHRPWPLRVALILLAAPVILVGLVGWSLENVYGGDPDRQEYVVGHAAETGRATVDAEDGERVVFDTIEDAEAYVESQRGGRNYTVPILLIAGGALLLLLGVSPSPRMREPEPVPPTELELRA